MVAEINALPTLYNGVEFRSRLEGRWAVFMDHLGVAWEYEAEGFDLWGDWYLPDFRIPHLEAWLEIKPMQPNKRERRVAELLSIASDKDVYTFCEGFHSDLARFQPAAESWLESSDGTPIWDDGYLWCECPTCGYIGIEFEGRSDRLGCHAKGCPRQNEFADRGHNATSYRLLAAYEAARTWKFR